MDTNSTNICRLCLEVSNDSVNIFENFQNSTIATILTQHFWFETYKKDGFSELLCQLCWSKTKTFHNFYKRIEQLQRTYWKSVNIVDNISPEIVSGETTASSDLIKQEQSMSPRETEVELDLDIVKYEALEGPIQEIELQVSDEESSDYNENNFDQSDSEQNSGSEEKTIGVKIISTVTDGKNANNELDELNESRQSSSMPCKKKEEDAQISEFCNMKCDLCNDPFETLVKAKTHYRKVHNTIGYLTCCGKKFYKRYRVLEHIRRHFIPNSYRCDPCGKNFANKRTLKIHLEHHKPFTSRTYKCRQYCSKEDKKFRCDKCNKNFASKSLLGCHTKRVHEFAYVQVCDICARVFKSEGSFENHMQEHSGVVRPKVQCTVCGVWLKHELSFRKHLRRHYRTQDVVPARCTICNKVSQNEDALKKHIQYVHGERRYQCTICNKAFKTSTILKEHMASHTGEDLYKCPYCIKTFKSNANMHSHRKKAHFTEWTRDRTKRIAPVSVE